MQGRREKEWLIQHKNMAHAARTPFVPDPCRCTGVCYVLWRDPSSVPPTAPATLSSAVGTLPSLLSAQLRAQCAERMGKRFDAIMRRMPQAVVCVHNQPQSFIVNPAAAQLMGMARWAGEAHEH